MIVIANVFPKLQTVNVLVGPLCKMPCFGTRFDTQHDKVSQILAKSPSESFYHVFPSYWEKLIWNISPILLGVISGMFLNILSADRKYPIGYWENLALPIQMQLSEKWKSFFQIFLRFLESTANSKYFEEKDDGNS